MKSNYELFKNEFFYLIVVFLLVCSCVDTSAQERYKTSKGQLVIQTIIDDNAITIKSNGLLVSLDYENGNIILKQDVSSLYTDSDTMLSIIGSIEDELMKFEGKIDIDYINTSGHPPIRFQVEGYLYPSNKFVIGSGTLVHITQASASSCILSLTFKIPYNEFFYGQQFDANDNYVFIDIKESVMARVNE